MVAIGLTKLSAGSGYEYLTRQVAALDGTGLGGFGAFRWHGVGAVRAAR